MESKSGQGYDHVVAQPVPENNLNGRSSSALDRFGTKTVILLLGAVVVEIAALGFIGFLWYGDINNNVWYSIVVNEWVPRSVTLASLGLRIAVAIQGGLCLSMLAAMAVERVAIPIGNVTDISLMRAGNKTDLLSVLVGFVWPMVYNKGSRRDWSISRGFVLCFVLLILATMTLFQFVSTVLVGDLSLQVIPGRNKTLDVTYDYLFTNPSPDPNAGGSIATYSYIQSSTNHSYPKYGYNYILTNFFSYWQLKAPTTWPAFAEYSQPPYQAKNVSDTGVSLRAFLPLGSSEDRQTIRNYTGKAVVLDSRVTCQRPVVTNATWNFKGWNYIDFYPGNNSYFGTLEGTVGPSTKTPRQNNNNGAEGKALFSCIMNLFNSSIEPAAWSICELAPTLGPLSVLPRNSSFGKLNYWSNGLDGMLHDPKNHNYTQQGAAFLVVVPTSQGGAGVPVDTVGSSYASVKPVSTFNGTRPEEFAMTLCYTALDVADRFIEAYSDQKRTEPGILFNKINNTLDMSAVISQLDAGYLAGGNMRTPEDRGILHLKGRSDWSESSPDQLYIDGPDQLAYVDTAGGYLGGGGRPAPAFDFTPNPLNAVQADGNLLFLRLYHYLQRSLWISGGLTTLEGNIPAGIAYTALLLTNYTLYPWSTEGRTVPWDSNDTGGTAPTNLVNTQEWITALFKSLKTEPALAMQALLTSIAGVAYYDRLSQYTKSAPTSQTFFVTALSPGGPYGKKRTGMPAGLLAVIILLAVHITLVAIVVARFLTQSKTTRIGDGWQAIAQVAVSGELRPIMDAASAPDGNKRRVRDLIGSEDMRTLHVIQDPKGDAVTFERTARVL